MTNRSLQSLVISRIIAATLVFTVILTGLLYIQLDKTLLILRNRTITDEAYDIASSIEETEEGALFLDLPEDERQFYAEAKELHQYVVRDENGKIIFTSPVAYTDLFPTDGPEKVRNYFSSLQVKKVQDFLAVLLFTNIKTKNILFRLPRANNRPKPSLMFYSKTFYTGFLFLGRPLYYC